MPGRSIRFQGLDQRDFNAQGVTRALRQTEQEITNRLNMLEAKVFPESAPADLSGSIAAFLARRGTGRRRLRQG